MSEEMNELVPRYTVQVAQGHTIYYYDWRLTEY